MGGSKNFQVKGKATQGSVGKMNGCEMPFLLSVKLGLFNRMTGLRPASQRENRVCPDVAVGLFHILLNCLDSFQRAPLTLYPTV